MNTDDARVRRAAALKTPEVRDIAGALTALLADIFARYVKTKNFHRHVSGPHFRDYHRLLDEQADQIFATSDAIAERVRKLGGTTLRSIGYIVRLQRAIDNDADCVSLHEMLAELREDNAQLAAQLHNALGLCDDRGDIGTAGLIENWVDEAKGGSGSFFEATHNGNSK